MFKKLFLVFALLFSILNAKDTLVVGVENETERLNPLYDEDHNIMLGLVFNGLFSYKNDKLEYDLIKNVEKNGLEYTFTLRDDVYFHDGVKLSSDDVIYTFSLARDEKLNPEVLGNFLDIKDVSKIDDLKFKITLKHPYPSFYEVLSLGIMPKHIVEKIGLDEFDKHPVGTGPYKFVERKSGEYIKLIAHDKFHKHPAKIKEVILKFVQDPNLVALELETNKLDISIIAPLFLDKLSKNKNLKYEIMPSTDYRALMFNMKKFPNKDLRKAISLAICKDDLVKGILNNLGSVANNPIQKQVKLDINYETCNKDLAKQILVDLGYELKNGKFYDKSGKPLSFDIYTFNFDLLRTQMAYYIKQELDKLGINAKVFAKEHGSFEIDKVDSFLIGWGSVYGADFYTYRVFSKEYDVETNENGLNYNHYDDSEVSKYLSLARTTDDEKLKSEYYTKAMLALKDNPPYVFLAYIDYVIAYNKNLKGIKNHTLGHHGNGYLYGIEDFYFED